MPLLKVPGHWDKSTDYHDFPSGIPLIIAAVVITIIRYVIEWLFF